MADFFTETQGLELLKSGKVTQEQFDRAKLAGAFAPEPAQQSPVVSGAPVSNVEPTVVPTPAPISTDRLDVGTIAGFQKPQEQPVQLPSVDQYKPLIEAEKKVGLAEVKKAEAADTAARQLADAIGVQKTEEQEKQKRLAQIADESNKEVEEWKNFNAQSQADLRTAAAVNPNRFWENKSTGAKIGLAISVLLGGISQGLTRGQSNPVIGLIEKEIDRDIELQKQSFDNKKAQASDTFNMYRFYMNKYNDADKALAASKTTMLELQKQELMTRAAAVNSPIAKANAEKAVATLDAQIKSTQDKLAADMIKKRVGEEAETGQKGITAEQLNSLDKEQKALAVKLPSGTYKLALTADDAKQIKETQQAIANLRTTVGKIEELQQKYGRELYSGSPASKKAEQLRLDAALNLRKMYDISGLRPGMIEEIKSMVPDATAFRQGKVTEKIKGFREKLNSLENEMLNVRLPNYKGITQKPLE